MVGYMIQYLPMDVSVYVLKNHYKGELNHE